MMAIGVQPGPRGYHLPRDKQGNISLLFDAAACSYLTPYPTIDWKFHKLNRSGRYITACHNSVTARLSELLGAVLTYLTPVLREVWEEHFRSSA